METRDCTSCKMYKPFSEFIKKVGGKHGLCSTCKQCQKEKRAEQKSTMDAYNKEYYQKNSEKLKQYQKEYNENNKEKVVIRKAAYYQRVKSTVIKAYVERNAERIRLHARLYRTKNAVKIRKYMQEYLKRYAEINREKLLAQKRTYYYLNKETLSRKASAYKKKNRALFNAHNSVRRASILQRTPDWLTREDHQEMAEYYRLSKYLESLHNEKYHVDHIVPLQGKSVCGLHVPWNLQILTAKENLIKSNKLLDHNNQISLI